MAFIETIFWTLVALGVLVTFHEFGHFYVARLCGVRVLRFSVGFGKPLCSWYDKKGTQYCLAGIPLGGYVKMLDEREGDVAPEDLPYAFTQKNVWQRIAIVAAGPLANFLLAIVFFWALVIPGERGLAPIVDQVDPGSIAAQAGLEVGQEIIAVDGVATPTRQALAQQLLSRMGETGTLFFTATYPDSEIQYTMEADIERWMGDADQPDPIKDLGLVLYYPDIPAVIGQVLPNTPAATAGLQVGDKIIQQNGEPVGDWVSWTKLIREYPDVPVTLKIQRQGLTLDVAITPARKTGPDGDFGQVGVGAQPFEIPEGVLRTWHYSPLEALVRASEKTWQTSVFVLASVKKLIVGQISTKNLSGPITIAKVASSSAQAGWMNYVSFLALLSVSLGVFNLLPIPVLDGGHLFFYLVELVKGSPVAQPIQEVGFRIGLVLVMGIMVLAVYNDILRL